MAVRSATERDRDAVLALGVAEEAAWFGEAELSAEEIGEWIDEEGGLDHGLVAVDSSGPVCGFASPGRHAAMFLADPVRTDAVADELLPWLHGQRAVVELMTFAGDRARVTAFERHRLRHRRSSFSMVRPNAAGPVSAAVFPDGVEVARYRLGDGDEAVHRLIYVDAAWAAVPGHGERDLQAWRVKERRCRSMFLASRGGRPVGWVAGRVLDGGRGYITTLAVAASERGRGLGRGLLLYAFADLQRAGARELTLAVEAENETALGLYRSVGLEVEREWQIYDKWGCV
jgi:ribosomal protein S18 acetylase RimI-like enzyme